MCGGGRWSSSPRSDSARSRLAPDAEVVEVLDRPIGVAGEAPAHRGARRVGIAPRRTPRAGPRGRRASSRARPDPREEAGRRVPHRGVQQPGERMSTRRTVDLRGSKSGERVSSEPRTSLAEAIQRQRVSCSFSCLVPGETRCGTGFRMPSRPPIMFGGRLDCLLMPIRSGCPFRGECRFRATVRQALRYRRTPPQMALRRCRRVRRSRRRSPFQCLDIRAVRPSTR
jgi:hypothetical protein